MNERLLWIGGLAAGGVALAAGLVFAASKQAAASVPKPGQTGTPSGQLPISIPVTVPRPGTQIPVATPVASPPVATPTGQSPVQTPVNPIVVPSPAQTAPSGGGQTGPITSVAPPITRTNPTGNPVFTQPPPSSTPVVSTPPVSNIPNNTQNIVIKSGVDAQSVSIAPNTDVFVALPAGAVWIPVSDYQTMSSFQYLGNPDTWPQDASVPVPVFVMDPFRQTSGTVPIEFTYIGAPSVTSPITGAVVPPPMSPVFFWRDPSGNMQGTTLQINSFA
jgi:hypothetical protein